MSRRTKDRGTVNVLTDLDFPDAEELTAKTVLAKKINDIVLSRSLAGHFTRAPDAGLDGARAARRDHRPRLRSRRAGPD